MATTIGIAIVVFIVAAVAFIATRPASFRIERSAQISAPGSVVFALINDFHAWRKWSPYDKLDSNMKQTYEGAPAGPGAIYSWTGNDKAGQGRATIEESKAGEMVSIKLEFSKPFAATCQATFKLVPSETGTRVSWIMDGKNNFMAKAVSIVMDMDAMVGKDFEEGLANLNTAAQAEAHKSDQSAP